MRNIAWEQRKAGGLRLVAPRLYRALCAYRADQAARSEQRGAVLQLERLVAHRELQLVRAGTTRNPRYVHEQQRKLDQARKHLARAQRRLEAIR